MLAGANCRKAASKIDWYFTLSAADHLFVRFPACSVMNPLFFARSFSGRSAVPVHGRCFARHNRGQHPKSMPLSICGRRSKSKVHCSGRSGGRLASGGKLSAGLSARRSLSSSAAPSTLAALASARGGRLAVTAWLRQRSKAHSLICMSRYIKRPPAVCTH